MADDVRVTCPKCATSLRIPAAWAEKAVKCKKCGAVIPGRKPATAAVPTAQRVPKPAPAVAPETPVSTPAVTARTPVSTPPLRD